MPKPIPPPGPPLSVVVVPVLLELSGNLAETARDTLAGINYYALQQGYTVSVYNDAEIAGDETFDVKFSLLLDATHARKPAAPAPSLDVRYVVADTRNDVSTFEALAKVCYVKPYVRYVVGAVSDEAFTAWNSVVNSMILQTPSVITKEPKATLISPAAMSVLSDSVQDERRTTVSSIRVQATSYWLASHMVNVIGRTTIDGRTDYGVTLIYAQTASGVSFRDSVVQFYQARGELRRLFIVAYDPRSAESAESAARQAFVTPTTVNPMFIVFGNEEIFQFFIPVKPPRAVMLVANFSYSFIATLAMERIDDAEKPYYAFCDYVGQLRNDNDLRKGVVRSLRRQLGVSFPSTLVLLGYDCGGLVDRLVVDVPRALQSPQVQTVQGDPVCGAYVIPKNRNVAQYFNGAFGPIITNQYSDRTSGDTIVAVYARTTRNTSAVQFPSAWQEFDVQSLQDARTAFSASPSVNLEMSFARVPPQPPEDAAKYQRVLTEESQVCEFTNANGLTFTSPLTDDVIAELVVTSSLELNSSPRETHIYNTLDVVTLGKLTYALPTDVLGEGWPAYVYPRDAASVDPSSVVVQEVRQVTLLLPRFGANHLVLPLEYTYLSDAYQADMLAITKRNALFLLSYYHLARFFLGEPFTPNTPPSLLDDVNAIVVLIMQSFPKLQQINLVVDTEACTVALASQFILGLVAQNIVRVNLINPPPTWSELSGIQYDISGQAYIDRQAQLFYNRCMRYDLLSFGADAQFAPAEISDVFLVSDLELYAGVDMPGSVLRLKQLQDIGASFDAINDPGGSREGQSFLDVMLASVTPAPAALAYVDLSWYVPGMTLDVDPSTRAMMQRFVRSFLADPTDTSALFVREFNLGRKACNPGATDDLSSRITALLSCNSTGRRYGIMVMTFISNVYSSLPSTYIPPDDYRYYLPGALTSFFVTDAGRDVLDAIFPYSVQSVAVTLNTPRNNGETQLVFGTAADPDLVKPNVQYAVQNVNHRGPELELATAEDTNVSVTPWFDSEVIAGRKTATRSQNLLTATDVSKIRQLLSISETSAAVFANYSTTQTVGVKLSVVQAEFSEGVVGVASTRRSVSIQDSEFQPRAHLARIVDAQSLITDHVATLIFIPDFVETCSQFWLDSVLSNFPAAPRDAIDVLSIVYGDFVGTLYDMSVACMDAVRASHVNGPIVLAGFGMGGMIMQSMAQLWNTTFTTPAHPTLCGAAFLSSATNARTQLYTRRTLLNPALLALSGSAEQTKSTVVLVQSVQWLLRYSQFYTAGKPQRTNLQPATYLSVVNEAIAVREYMNAQVPQNANQEENLLRVWRLRVMNKGDAPEKGLGVQTLVLYSSDDRVIVPERSENILQALRTPNTGARVVVQNAMLDPAKQSNDKHNTIQTSTAMASLLQFVRTCISSYSSRLGGEYRFANIPPQFRITRDNVNIPETILYSPAYLTKSLNLVQNLETLYRADAFDVLYRYAKTEYYVPTGTATV